MLVELSIRNFALIESAILKWGPGLNILTGETGTGKSMILGALQTILGERAATDWIRKGEDTCHIEARFNLAPSPFREELENRLEKLGMETDPEGEFIIRRTISRTSNKNRIYINGHLATRQNLVACTEQLVDISGQRENQILLKPENHIQLLDFMVGQPELFKKIRNQIEQINLLYEEWQRVSQQQSEGLKKQDYLTYQIQELEAIDPKPSEDAQLQEEIKRLSHTEDLLSFSQQTISNLDDREHSLCSQLRETLQQTQNFIRIDSSLQNIHNQIQEALILLEEAARDLSRFSSDLSSNPQQLQELEDRLQSLHQLQRKYGMPLDAIHEELAKMQKELEDIQNSEEQIQSIIHKGQEFIHQAKTLDQEIHALRVKKAHELQKKIIKELNDLAMKDCDFQIHFETLTIQKENFPCHARAAGFHSRGRDHVEFQIAPNKGEGLSPLHQIASGGELSRILLGLKCILSPGEEIGSYFFDEVDSGIGGQTANAVGYKLKKLSQKKQVICITHLPQIACFADHHIAIHKKTQKGRTKTIVQSLSKEDRIEELARMLGGDASLTTSRKHAKELINQCTST